MCRLLGVVSSETTNFRFSLHEAPRSLSVLSKDHPHGWGVAVHSQTEGWAVERHPACAGEDERFHDAVASARGEVLLAHIRKATVGEVRTENTHPFRRGRFVFAHNGTVDDLAFLARRTSPARAAEVEGDTDSERLLAHLLTLVDEQSGHVDDALAIAARALDRRPKLGAVNFLLSDGQHLWAFRRGRSLFVLERGKGDEVRAVRDSVETLARLETPWSPLRHALLVASERMTDEPWREVPEGTLLRIDAGGRPHVTTLVSGS